MDQDLQTKLDQINKNLEGIKKGRGIWRSFFNGMFGAFGYLFGVFIILLIFGWYLNKIGFWPAFQSQVKNFGVFMEDAGNILSGEKQPKEGSGGEEIYEFTLPNGQNVQITQ